MTNLFRDAINHQTPETPPMDMRTAELHPLKDGETRDEAAERLDIPAVELVNLEGDPEQLDKLADARRAQLEQEARDAVPAPTLGRIVHYITRAGVTWPAIVTAVHEDTIDLTSFPPGASPTPWVDVALDADRQARHSWHWPPRD